MLETLWIMRHGLAENEFDSDFNRALSQVGQQQASSVAKQILNNESDLPTKMLVSPFKRTQQTGLIVEQVLALKTPFETEDMLVHFGDHQVLASFLLAQPQKHLMIVSHMPIVVELLQFLVKDCNIYAFQTAQVVKVTFEQSNNIPCNAVVSKVYLAS